MTVRLSQTPKIHPGCILENAVLGVYTEIGRDNCMENVRIGDYSYTGPWCILQNADIGKFSNIAAMVRIGPVFHPMDRPTLHHFTYRRVLYGFSETDDEDFFAWRKRQIITIGHDTWIGHGAILMPGIAVGNGAVIGSGSVVTGDVTPYSIVAGVPARTIRSRFPGDIVKRLERIRWWDWSHKTLGERLHDFILDAQTFAEKYDNNEAQT